MRNAKEVLKRTALQINSTFLFVKWIYIPFAICFVHLNMLPGKTNRPPSRYRV